jgi:hypothetical protein
MRLATKKINCHDTIIIGKSQVKYLKRFLDKKAGEIEKETNQNMFLFWSPEILKRVTGK